MRCLAGHSLIGLAGMVLARLSFIDQAIISTDSADYAREAERYGLAAPFLRPDDLSTDAAIAIDVVAHGLAAMEQADGRQYDSVLIIEPTSPLRLPSDVMATAALLFDEAADSAVTVSAVPARYHPLKQVSRHDNRLKPFLAEGATVTNRQALSSLYWRNGVTYALTRDSILDQRVISGRHTVGLITDHPVANIDTAEDLAWADYQIEHGMFELAS